ncbi:hypothetical protein, partial [Paenibacillus sp. E194]|uniref:hypothetical protein n=1 Tax=Paenibacillus sp. E194 TaxID=1458845 RepID=UPI0005C85854
HKQSSTFKRYIGVMRLTEYLSSGSLIPHSVRNTVVSGGDANESNKSLQHFVQTNREKEIK